MKVIEKELQPFLNNPNFVFKSCQEEWLVVLKKILKTNDPKGPYTKTNEEREVYDSNYAQFRGSRFKVVAIINKFDPTKKTCSIKSSYFRNSVIYKVGEIVEPDEFDLNPSNIFSNGIHYFKTPEPAYYYELNTIQNGILKEWYDNGCCEYIINFKEKIPNGEFNYWYSDGKLYQKYHFKNGKRNGEYQKWHNNGILSEHCYYKDGEIDGDYIRWDNNGQLLELRYHIDGKYISWANFGQLFKHRYYKDGNQYKECILL